MFGSDLLKLFARTFRVQIRRGDVDGLGNPPPEVATGLAKWRGNVTNLIRSRRHVEEQRKGKVSARVRRRDLVNVASLIVVAQGFSRRQRFAKSPTSTENAPLIYAMTVSEWSIQ